MAKTTAALLGFGASGQIGKTQVYSSWRGRPYARRHVVPANPNTSAQQQTRSVFGFLSLMWKLSDADFQAPWTAFAKGKPLTNRNALMKSNVSNLRSATNLSSMLASPGANGGLAADAPGATGGSGSIAVTLTAPDIPSDWTIAKAVWMATLDANPQTATAALTYTESDTTSTYSASFTSLPAGSYRVFGWFVYNKPDGTLAYGPSKNATATVS